MAERMNTMFPTLEPDGTTFTLNVANTLIESDLKKKKADIERFMRQQLHNSRLTMNIVISEAVVSARLLTPREQFEEMATINPALHTLMEEFNLDLV